MTPPTVDPTLSPGSLLFAHYVAGRIDDPVWREIMKILDADATPEGDREALANFLGDALRELGPEAVRVPRMEEVREMLTDLHPVA